jgi:hypothetical protein
MMTHALACNEITPEPPGFLLAPFGWAAEPLAAMAHVEPTMLLGLFTISRPRMHLMALALAHLDWPVPSGIGSLLTRGSMRQVLDRVLGQHPPGVKRALHRLPVNVLQRQNYRRLVIFSPTPALQRSSTMQPRSTTWRSRFLATCRRPCADRCHSPWRIGHEN